MDFSKDISRRGFIKGLAGALGLFAFGSLWPKENNDLLKTSKVALSKKQTRYLRQIITQNNNTSRRLMWQGDTPMSSPKVVLRATGEEIIEKITPVEAFFHEDGENIYQYSALLENLEENKNYQYAIEDGEARGEWHSLVTGSGQETFSMLIFPDSQSSDYKIWQEVAQAAWNRHPQASLFANLGDLVDNGEDKWQWKGWFEGAEGILEQISLAPVIGNHECYDRNWQIREPKAYLNYFALPANNSTSWQGYYYSFDYGSIHCISLSTVAHELGDAGEDMMKDQLRWLEEDLASTRKKWRVVMMHRDVLEYRIHGRPERKEGFSEEGVIFMPVFEKYGVDVVFTAHLHTYRNRGHIFQQEKSSKGPLYILGGLAGNVRYPGLWIDHYFDKVTAPQPETDNYLLLSCKENELLIECFLPDGTKLDEERIVK